MEEIPVSPYPFIGKSIMGQEPSVRYNTAKPREVNQNSSIGF